MKSNIDNFFEKISERNLVKICKDLSHNKFNGLVKTLSQIIINQYGIDPLYATTIIRNSIHEILSKRYIKLIEKLKNKNEFKKS
jgi:hypothetical protein